MLCLRTTLDRNFGDDTERRTIRERIEAIAEELWLFWLQQWERLAPVHRIAFKQDIDKLFLCSKSSTVSVDATSGAAASELDGHLEQLLDEARNLEASSEGLKRAMTLAAEAASVCDAVPES